MLQVSCPAHQCRATGYCICTSQMSCMSLPLFVLLYSRKLRMDICLQLFSAVNLMYCCCAQINIFSGLMSVWMMWHVSWRYLSPCSTWETRKKKLGINLWLELSRTEELLFILFFYVCVQAPSKTWTYFCAGIRNKTQPLVMRVQLISKDRCYDHS